MKVAAYVRVSTDEQHEENQIQEIKKYCAFKGWTDIEFFIDKGVSGGAKVKPARQKMLQHIVTGKFQVMIVWKYDRATRSLSDLIALRDLLLSKKVDFVSMTESLDTTTPSGELMFNILGSFAQWERAVISERTKAFMRTAKERGVHCGRKREVDREEVYRLKDSGVSASNIAVRLGRHPEFIRRILRERKAA